MPTTAMSGTNVSVVIPVFNDPDRLRNCLQALDNQTYPKDLYEVIVVDNGSKESIEPIISSFSIARVVQEQEPGSYAARNKGLSIAKGRLFAFTDSDCIPSHDWIEKGVARLLASPNCGLVAGKIKIFFHDPYQPTAVELDQSINAFPQNKYIEDDRYGATANLFTFKNVFDEIGPFNDSLKSGGDREWGQRVYNAGYQLLYADEVVVNHPARRTYGELFRKCARCTQDIRHLGAFGILRVYLSLLRPPIRYILGAMKEKKIRGLKQLLQIILVISLKRTAVIWEHTRLLLGGEPRR